LSSKIARIVRYHYQTYVPPQRITPFLSTAWQYDRIFYLRLQSLPPRRKQRQLLLQRCVVSTGGSLDERQSPHTTAITALPQSLDAQLAFLAFFISPFSALFPTCHNDSLPLAIPWAEPSLRATAYTGMWLIGAKARERGLGGSPHLFLISTLYL